MKLDKETLIKQHYWIGLGLLPFLALFMIIWLMVSVSSETSAKEEEIDKQLKTLKGKQAVKNQAMINLRQQANAIISGQKNKIWKEAWDAQKNLMSWPPELAELDNYPYGYDIDKVNDKFCGNYVKPTIHLKQYEDMSEIAAPTQLLNGWQAVLDPLTWKQNDLPPTSADLWIEQENIWVRRSLLNIVKDANDLVRVFKPQPPKDSDKNLPRGVLARKTFSSPFWQLDLQLDDKNLTGTLKNIGKKRRSPNVSFRVQLQENNPKGGAIIKHEGNPISPEDPPVQLTPVPVKTLVSAGLFGVEQILDKWTVPVKEIQEIDLTWPCHRFVSYLLRPHPSFKAMLSDTTLNYGTTSKHGLNFYRYIDATPQVRRMSVALVLTVDQDHIQDVLATFSSTKDNSATGRDTKLRMQPTQMHWQHVADNVAWSDDPKTPGLPKPPQPGPMGSMTGPRPAGMGPGAPGTFFSPLDEERSNLVELSLYGILSLYERFTEPVAPAPVQ